MIISIWLKKKIKLNKKKIKILNQVHSNKVVLIDKTNINKIYNADAIITKDRNICIAVLTADCCPIFLFDSSGTFISCVHAGWKGCYLNIIKKTIEKILKLQKNTKDIRAIIGPCLDKKNFEVDKIFKTKFIKKDSSYEKFFSKSKKNKCLFDMRGLIKYQILKSNIKNIENINLDTYSNKDLFFSHRRAKHLNQNPTGRMINIIGFSN